MVDKAVETLPQHFYTYLVTDLRTNDVLAELPLQTCRYARRLSGVGDASAELKINPEILTTDPRTVTAPGKTGLYILRDGQPMWGGIIWKSNYVAQNRVLSLSAKTFESYFYHRFNHTTKYWADTDQLEIARWLVKSNGSAAEMLMDVSDVFSFKKRERVMFGYEFKTTGEELEQLANLKNGFDWNVLIVRDSNDVLRRRLNFYYPQAGTPQESTNLFFEYPGGIENFTLNEDAENSANVIWAIGVGEGTEQITSRADVYDQLAAGWPMLEASRSYKSVTRYSTLQAHANSIRDRIATPITVFEVTVRGNVEPYLGSYDLGDWARFRMEDAFMTPALDTYARITGIDVTVENNTGKETVTLILGGNEVESQSEQRIQ